MEIQSALVVTWFRHWHFFVNSEILGVVHWKHWTFLTYSLSIFRLLHQKLEICFEYFEIINESRCEFLWNLPPNHRIINILLPYSLVLITKLWRMNQSRLRFFWLRWFWLRCFWLRFFWLRFFWCRCCRLRHNHDTSVCKRKRDFVFMVEQFQEKSSNPLFN